MAITLKRLNEEVYFAEDPIVRVGREDIEMLKRLALDTRRKRVRLCAHRGVEDALHEMLIVHTKEAYVRPHKHLNKAESFHLVEGAVDVVFFDDDGAIRDVVCMGRGATGDSFFYRISGPQYHTLLIRSDFVVFHEATSGPFVREQTAFAPWAPAEDDLAGQAAFFRRTDESVRRFLAARGK
ncbi:MAG: WbuC family cupin fold metalloprotein [Burkholderiales bacterium]